MSENDNTRLLQEILSKLTNLTDEITGVKKEIANVRATVKDIVVEELTVRDKVWSEEKQMLLKKVVI